MEANPNYRFDITGDWKNYLLNAGFVVVSGIVNKEQAARYLAQTWDVIEELSNNNVKRDDLATRKKHSNYPYMMHGGMIQYLGHSQVQWDVREACAPIFAELYNVPVEQLSTSFDGLCFMDGTRGYKKQDPTSFLHADQAPSKRFQYSVQGILNLVDNGPDNGGFVCVPGSHLYRDFWDAKVENGEILKTSDWYLFSEQEKRSDPMFNEWIKVCAQAGDIILWDSRTWHCNTTPSGKYSLSGKATHKEKVELADRHIRVCIYVCMLPKISVSDKVKMHRREAVVEGRVTSHHPGAGFRKFPKKPQYCTDATYNRAVAIQQRLIMTPLQKTLADIV